MAQVQLCGRKRPSCLLNLQILFEGYPKKITFNYNKSDHVVFRQSGNCYPWIPSVEAGGLSIWSMSSVRYLGIINHSESLSF